MKIWDETNKKYVDIPAIRGRDGITPHIGANGNWWIGDDDTRIPASGGGGSADITIDHTLKYDQYGNLGVNTASVVEKDNTLPITSAAVETTVGNIEILLKTI